MTDSQNRAFMYGESVFTTMLMVGGVVQNWEHHFDRFKRGVEYLYGPFTDHEWIAYLKNRAEYKIGQETGDKVLRLTAYIDQTRGLRSPMISVMDLKIQLHAHSFEPRDTRLLNMRTVIGPAKPNWWPDFLKAGNYLETIISQKIHLKGDDDDLIFVSPEGVVCESSVANIFCVRHNKLYTAPLGPNVLDGVMRKRILEVGYEFFDEVIESSSHVDQLMNADAVFGTNSVRGPFLIGKIDDVAIDYTPEFLAMFERLRKRVFQ